MKACSRLFQVEAMRDGRLAGAELAHFERHLTACLDCSREVQALEALAEGLRSSDGAGENELHARRERTRLLAAFDRALVSPQRNWTIGRRLLDAVALAALFTALLFWHRRQVGPHAVTEPSPLIRASPLAVWSHHAVGNRTAIVLERGALFIHVDHAAEGRLVVILPDGELEDTGTSFTVQADDGHTTSVVVQEGSVVLRLRGQPAVEIGAGAQWVPSASGGAPVAAIASERAAPLAPRKPPRSSPSHAGPAALRVAPASDASIDFRAAMTRLDLGDNAEAAKAFADFLRRYPLHPRGEDAAYLQVIALQRLGDDLGMREAALEYLRRFPRGFRRAEVEVLAR